MEFDPQSPVLLLHQINRAHLNAVKASLGAAGLREIGNPVVLFELSRCRKEGHTLSQRELARRMHISPPTLAVSLKTLSRGGYVLQTPDPVDSRKNLVDITEKGLSAVDRCGEIFAATDRQLYKGFSPEETALLQTFYSRMLSNMQEIGGTPDGCPPPPPFRKDVT